MGQCKSFNVSVFGNFWIRLKMRAVVLNFIYNRNIVEYGKSYLLCHIES